MVIPLIVFKHGARLVSAYRDRFGVMTRTEIDWEQRVTHVRGRGAATPYIALTELAIVVETPTFEGVVVQDRAGVSVPGSQHFRAAVLTQIDR